MIAADAQLRSDAAPDQHHLRAVTTFRVLTALGVVCALAAGCGGGSDRARPLTGLKQDVVVLPWHGRLPSGESIRINVRGGAPRVDCVDVRTGEYDSSDYCVTDSRSDLLNANTQLDCGTGDALLVGSVAHDDLTLQLQPHRGRARNAIRFKTATITGSRRLVELSFAAAQLPVRLLLLDAHGKAVETHDIGDQTDRCGGNDSKLLFGWL